MRFVCTCSMFHVEMLSRGDALSVLISKRKSHKGGDEGTTKSKGANTNIMIKISSLLLILHAATAQFSA